jgi:hypothetical protein
MRFVPFPLVCVLALLAGCGDAGKLADSVRQAAEGAYEKDGLTIGDEKKTTGAECQERSSSRWRCEVTSADELLVYGVVVGPDECWRGRLLETRETSARAIPVQFDIRPNARSSIRGCL